MNGREVATLIDGEGVAGVHTLSWKAGSLATGLYFARLEQLGQTAAMKLLLVR